MSAITSTAPTIAFIGGGNMAQALIAGLLNKGHAAKQLHVADTDNQKLQSFAEQGIHTYDANDSQNSQQTIRNANIVILAVKPQVIEQVLAPLKSSWSDQLVISIAAGIGTESLSQWLGESVKLVRAMPNTPAMIQMGATGLFATAAVSTSERQQVEQIMAATGLVLWVEDETLLHAVTAVSGSAPAYFFYLIEHMIKTGEQLGLSNTQATALAMQTALGSAQMALTSHDTPAELRRKVTSPNGTTQAAIEIMDAKHMDKIIEEAMQGCVARSQAISAAISH